MWNKIKVKKSIFWKLIISFIVFACMSVAAYIGCLMSAAVILSGGIDEDLPPNEIVDENGRIEKQEIVVRLGGWIEELDDAHHVLRVVCGEKKTDIWQYSKKELSSLTKAGMNEENPYIGFCQYVEQTDTYFLVIYERSLIQVKTTLMLGEKNQGSTLTNFVLGSFLCCFLLICILLSMYLSRTIRKPLKQLVGGMERVKAGERDVQLDFKADYEFSQMRDAFNLMTRTIEENRIEKLAEQKKKERLLLELSHDIKTPIATIKSYANALESGLVAEEKKQQYYQTIDAKAKRVCDLSEKIFLMFKMENADYILQLERKDVCEVLRQTCAEYYEEIENAGFSFQINIPEAPIYGLMDEKSFERVIGNLLVNAKKYNKTGERIGVEVSSKQEQIEIVVWDDGECIPDDLQTTLFDAFVRGDKARKTDGGTGLGLSISKAIIEKHQGSLTYINLNQKNQFFIKIPKCRK